MPITMNDAIKNQFVYFYSKQKQLLVNDWLMFQVGMDSKCIQI